MRIVGDSHTIVGESPTAKGAAPRDLTRAGMAVQPVLAEDTARTRSAGWFPRTKRSRENGRDLAQALQEGEEAHADGAPLLGSVHAAFLPMQGVRAAPAPRQRA
jgi:hypothetical protein